MTGAARSVTDTGWVLASFDELTAREVYGILQLRSRIFVVEQDCVFLDTDGADVMPGTQHLFLPSDVEEPRPARDSHGGAAGLSVEPLAYARILPAGYPDGPAARTGARSAGRIVTSQENRGRGLGHRLMHELLRHFGDEDLTLNAQSHLAGFYGTHGFTVSGPEFLEDGIPHLPLHRTGDRTAQS